ncbi:MAG TPA: hypothetical protein VNM90_29280 [Haliangium sp.]|nr:hypothetical protein [Haliangium sp.]
MSNMSILVANRTREARYALSSLTTHGDEVVRGLLAQNQDLPPERRLDENEIRRLLDWLGAIIEHKTEALYEAELTYVGRQASSPALRAQRDVALPVVSAMLLQVRDRIKAVLGTVGLTMYGLRGRMPRRANAVATHAALVIELLRKQPRVVDDGLDGVLDTPVLAGALEKAWTPLRQALDALQKARHARAGAMIQRDERVDAWHEAYQGGATAVVGLYRVAGQLELAQRVRPTHRRRTGQEPPAAEVERDAPADDGTARPTER